ncbi:uncharacterized protein LOC142234664 [Haematobia irritans]|uniref:uncharacterized protein LOC142234664 n=1 Tax=Haematobia irritans TaxID=7368 RepID=UPI003F5081A2
MDIQVKINEKKINTANSEDDNWKAIFKARKFEEQLKLIKQGDDACKNVFDTEIWPVDYIYLNVDESEGYYIVRNESDSNRLLLTEEVFQDFISYYVERVQTLMLGPSLDIRTFRNVKALKCSLRHKSIGNFLQQISIAESLPNLQSIHLKELDMECGANTEFGDESMSRLLKMEHLKRIRLDFFFSTRITYGHYCQLISNKNLETLEGNLELDDGETDAEAKYFAIPYVHSLNTLQITLPWSTQKWSSQKFSLLQEIFGKLSNLSVKFTNDLQDDTLFSFASCCKSLKKLTITGTNFINIKSFVIPSTLQELHLKWCRGLTQENIRQILTQTNLMEFTSCNTKIEGNFQNFKISPSIQSLKIERIDICEFQGAYANNENLKNLTWYHIKNCKGNLQNKDVCEDLSQASAIDEESFDLVPKNQMILSSHIDLGTCVNLETLDMGHKLQLPLHIVMQLKNLRKLSTWIVDHTSEQWMYIRSLLKHPSLRELTINFIRTVTESSIEKFRTNVTTLHIIDFNYCESGLDFFLDLFCENPNLKLSLFLPPLAFVRPLRCLINHRKFPVFLKTMEIYGFRVDCEELRTNFYATMKKFKFVRNVFEDNPKDSIVLSRDDN